QLRVSRQAVASRTSKRKSHQFRRPNFLILNAPGESRTPDLRIRSPSLYPAELRARHRSVAQSFLTLWLGRQTFQNRIELVEIEWFHQVIFNAFLRGFYGDAGIGDTGHDQYRQLRFPVTDVGNELETVNVRHLQVKANEIEILKLDYPHHVTSVRCGDWTVAALSQPFSNDLEKIGLVVDEEESHTAKDIGVTRGGERNF